MATIDLAHDDVGDGPAVVLIHGHPFNRSMWAPQLAALRDRFRVIAPDLRGYGDSPVTPGTVPMARLAADVSHLLDGKGIATAALVGLSMGGLVVMELAAAQPERWWAYGFIATTARRVTEEELQARQASARIMEGHGMRPVAEQMAARLFGPDPSAELRAQVMAMMLATSPAGAAAAVRGRAERPDYHPVLRSLRAPALVCTGDRDSYSTAQVTAELVSCLHDPEVVLMDGVGHLPNLERRGDFNERLLDFLTRARPANLAPMSTTWPDLPYEQWRATCDTLHAHTQVLGKLAARLAPPEPQLQHAALRLTARGWETLPLPAPDRSGSMVVVLDLRSHEAVIEHSGGRTTRVPLTPHRPVGAVTRDVLAAVRDLGGPVEIDPTPQEVPWQVPLDEDEEHARYDPAQVGDYFAAATRAAQVLAAYRAPYRGRSTPVNAWWGSFDLAVSLFSGLSVDPPSRDFIMRNAGDAQQIEVGWWPGDARYPKAAFYAYAHPAPPGFAGMTLSPPAARWDAALGEYILDWDDARTAADPHAAAVEFARSAFRHACVVCGWDPGLAASLEGTPPPVI